jgi:hypothetical protein
MFIPALTLALTLAGTSLWAAPPTLKGAATAPHKSKVPVAVTTVFGEGKATVTLRFEQPVSQAVIGFRGLDGLTVISASDPGRTQFKRGEVVVFALQISPGLGQSHLAVDIEGKFRGQRRLGVQTFAVGKPTPEQEKATAGTVLTTSSGQRITIMPVKQ